MDLVLGRSSCLGNLRFFDIRFGDGQEVERKKPSELIQMYQVD